jgi:hypothetical protein
MTLSHRFHLEDPSRLTPWSLGTCGPSRPIPHPHAALLPRSSPTRLGKSLLPLAGSLAEALHHLDAIVSALATHVRSPWAAGHDHALLLIAALAKVRQQPPRHRPHTARLQPEAQLLELPLERGSDQGLA